VFGGRAKVTLREAKGVLKEVVTQLLEVYNSTSLINEITAEELK